VLSVTAARTFSMSAALVASTTTPGSTDPEGSLTTPAITAWAHAVVGRITTHAASDKVLTVKRMSHHPFVVGVFRRRHADDPRDRSLATYLIDHKLSVWTPAINGPAFHGPVDRVYRVGTKRRIVHTAMWLDALLERLASTRWMGFSRHVATGCERLRDTGAIRAIEDVLELGVGATRTMR
jgi:hypothetical protein